MYQVGRNDLAHALWKCRRFLAVSLSRPAWKKSAARRLPFQPLNPQTYRERRNLLKGPKNFSSCFFILCRNFFYANCESILFEVAMATIKFCVDLTKIQLFIDNSAVFPVFFIK